MPDGNATLAVLETKFGALPPTAEVVTGGNGRHLFYRTARPLRSTTLGPGIDFKAEDAFVVAPPSLHRSGQRYDWITPFPNSVAALPMLPDWVATTADRGRTRDQVDDGAATRRAAATAATAARSAASPTSAGLPPWLPEHLLVGTRHRLLARFAGWLRGCGYEEAAILAALREILATRVEQPNDDRIDASSLANLAHTMAQKATKHFGLRVRYEPIARTWRGRAGRTDRRVFFRGVLPTLARNMKATGERVAPLPSLTMAAMADVSDRTAARALKRLRIERKVVRLAGRRARQDDANRYQLVPPHTASRTDEGLCSYPTELRSVPSSLRENAVLLRELFRHEGLGHLAGELYGVVRREAGERAIVLHSMVGCSLSSVYRILNCMAACGLVVEVADGWRRAEVDRDALIAIARALGVLGKTAAERERRTLKRSLYHAPASVRRRQLHQKNRALGQRQLLDAARAREWPMIDGIVGETGWRRFAKTTRTRALWPMLARVRAVQMPENPTRVDRRGDISHQDGEPARGQAPAAQWEIER